MELLKKKQKQDEAQSPVAVETPAKAKKNLATMDVKDLFKSKKAKVETAPVDDLTIVPDAPVQKPAKKENAPKEKKQSLATMDVKDIMKLAKDASNQRSNIKDTKRTMNFVHHKSNFNVVKMLPVVLVLVIAAGVFVKVGFLDQMDKKTVAYSDLAGKQEKLAAINAKLTGYDELANEYGRYSYGWMSESETGLVNRIEILDLIEKKIKPHATVENISISNNTLTMNLHGITLEDTSRMVKTLEATDMVQSAKVYSASAGDDGQATIFIGITLVKVTDDMEG